MTDQEREAILSLCILASLADGKHDEQEQARIRQMAQSISAGGNVDLAALHQEVLAGRRSLEDAARAIQDPESRRIAYEAAAGVCLVDGPTAAPEREFLERLRRALGLEAKPAEEFARQAEALATVPLGGPAVGAPAGPSPAPPPDRAALDQKILNYAILNGALELLPESLASMGIIPLQMKMVYELGKAHGYELDQGHVKELLATLGVGLTSQYLEGIGRKIIGGILGRIGGGLLGGLGRQATSSAFSFASTWALGQVARDYYGGGRTMDAERLRQSFQRMLGEAKGMAQKYTGAIEEKARSIDVRQLVSIVKGP